MSLRLESWRITPACRQRGNDAAWEDAITRLREVYDAQLERFGDDPITLTVAIDRETLLDEQRRVEADLLRSEGIDPEWPGFSGNQEEAKDGR